MKTLIRLFAVLPLMQVSSYAAIIFADSFDRPDNRNIDASLAGITDNTSPPMPVDGVYTHPFIDPNAQSPIYGVEDTVASNGGAAQILSNHLQLALGAGTSNAYVNHNFTDPSILTAGGFSVSLAVTGYSQTTNAQGGGFALGMSTAELATTGDAFDGAHRMTGAFGNLIGATVPSASVSDFWVAIRGNNSLVWGSNTGTVQGITGLAANTGVISVDFNLSSFAAGSTVNYTVYLDSVAKGTGSFVWSGTNENYLGIDARDAAVVTFDNLSVSTIPEASSLGLLALGGLGLVRRRR